MPFPAFPPSLADRFSGARTGLRPFGIEKSDLGIDLAESDTPGLVTRILKECAAGAGSGISADLFYELSVSKRLECLLVLAAKSSGTALSFPFRCAGCGLELELELTLDEIAEQQREADLIETVEVMIRDKIFTIRKPTGRDQESWSGRVFADEKAAIGAMIGTLMTMPGEWETLEAADLDRINEALDEADPLVNFLCRVACADCGEPNEFLIDLCDTALGILARLQKQLIVMVHKLASHYHWSEEEIFAVPHWRRLAYLDLIAAGR